MSTSNFATLGAPGCLVTLTRRTVVLGTTELVFRVGGRGGSLPPPTLLLAVMSTEETLSVSLLVAFDRAGPANQTTASAAWNAAFDAGTLSRGLVTVGAPRK